MTITKLLVVFISHIHLTLLSNFISNLERNLRLIIGLQQRIVNPSRTMPLLPKKCGYLLGGVKAGVQLKNARIIGKKTLYFRS